MVSWTRTLPPAQIDGSVATYFTVKRVHVKVHPSVHPSVTPDDLFLEKWRHDRSVKTKSKKLPLEGGAEN